MSHKYLNLKTFYDQKRQTWRLLRGHETFYNESRELLEWDSEQQAIKWAMENIYTDNMIIIIKTSGPDIAIGKEKL